MTYRGHVKNGVVVLDEHANLPEGAEVEVEISSEETEPPKPKSPTGDGTTLGQRLMKYAGMVKDLPSDLSRNHDHYLHGTPKR